MAAKKRGRPSSFKPEYIAQAEKLCALGATDYELTDFFGCGMETLRRWKMDFPEFRAALKVGKDTPDDQVERSLLQRALGYSHPAVKFVTVGQEVQEVPYIERYPPDTTACIFWLKNRRRSDWTDVNRAEREADEAVARALIEVAKKLPA